MDQPLVLNGLFDSMDDICLFVRPFSCFVGRSVFVRSVVSSVVCSVDLFFAQLIY